MNQKPEKMSKWWLALAVILTLTMCGAIIALVYRAFMIPSNTSTDVLGVWMGPLLAILLTLFGFLITGIFIFMTFRIDRGAKQEATETARREIKQAIADFKEKSDSLLDEYQRAINDLNKRDLKANIEATHKEVKTQVQQAQTGLDKKPRDQYEYEDWYATGILAYQAKSYEAAIHAFDQTLLLSSNAIETIRALINKSVVLKMLNHSDEELSVYDEVVRRYGNNPMPELRERVAVVLVSKGIRLDQLDRSREALSVYNEVIRRYRNDPMPELRKQVVTALVFKGISLGLLKRHNEAILIYNEVARRYGDDPSPELREIIARALVYKGIILDQLNRFKEAISVYDEAARRYGNDPTHEVRELMASAYVNKGVSLDKLGLYEEAILVNEKMTQLYGKDPSPEIREQVAMALRNKSLMLDHRNRCDEAIQSMRQAVAIFEEIGSKELEKAQDLLHDLLEKNKN